MIARTLKWCILLCVLLFQPDLAHSYSGLFRKLDIIPTGSWPEAVAMGDFNSDGRNDVVVVTSEYADPQNDTRIHVFLQNALGGLDPAVKYRTASAWGSEPITLDTGDLNGDGRTDIAVGICGTGVQVFLQNAAGEFDPPVMYPTIYSCVIKVADLNNDGRADIAGIVEDIRGDDNVLAVFYQDASGSLGRRPVEHKLPSRLYGNLSAGDVNNDGLTDIVVMSGATFIYDQIMVLHQSPSGGFQTPRYYTIGDYLAYNAIGDLNGDGLNDIAFSYGWNSSPFIGVLPQNTDGSLAPFLTYPSLDNPEPLVTADMDLDGRMDAVVIHGGFQELGIFLQDQNGALLPELFDVLPYASHYRPQGLSAGDIDGDGANDVAIADYNHGLVIYYHTTAPGPDISISPSPTDFGSIMAGNSSIQVVSISNAGSADLTLGTIGLGGPDSAEFAIAGDICAGQILPPAAFCTVQVSFSPLSVGLKKASLDITSNDKGTPALRAPLTGSCITGSITVFNPNGGEAIYQGSEYKIRWGAVPEATVFTLSYSVDGGSTWSQIAQGVAGYEYTWQVPALQGVKRKCLVMITGYDTLGSAVGNDRSEGVFTIQ